MKIPWLLDYLNHQNVVTQRWVGHGLGSGIHVWVRRDDAMHPIVNGNKAYKLAFHLEGVMPGSTILSCGGVWSNQLHALAFAGRERGIRTAAIVRGYHEHPLTPTLSDCMEWGMRIHLVGRSIFAQRNEEPVVADWLDHYQADHWISEGANDLLGLKGLAIWAQQLKLWLARHPVDAVWLEAGTGAMASAIMPFLPKSTTLCVVPVVKDAEVINRLRSKAYQTQSKLYIIEGYDGGGFGRIRPKLKRFVSTFNECQPFKVEPVYSGKLVIAFSERATSVGSSHLIVHSGGLQGLRSQLGS